MTIFKTNQEIYLTAFDKMDYKFPTVGKSTPPEWHHKRPITFDDVVIWEQLYGKNGISLYAAWSPYADYYIIVHGLFLDKNYGIEEFHGAEATNLIITRFKSFGIDLPVKKLWTN